MDKILIIQTASIGDVILATPLLEALKHHFPDASIDILVRKGNESLFRNHPFLHRVLIWKKSRAKYFNLLKLIFQVRKGKYDLIINIQRFIATGLLTVFSGARVTIGFDKNPMSRFFDRKITHDIHFEKIHESERNLSLIEPLVGPAYFPAKIYPSKQDFAKVSGFKRGPYITISPASLWFTKQFPKNKWIEFLRSLKDKYTVYALGSASDHDLCQEIIDEAGGKKAANLAGKLDLLESAALMKDAKRNITNDSAPMHLASAVNAKTTAIFCSTVTDFGFGPLSDDAIVVETEKNLRCRPCGLHGLKACPEKHFDCANSIMNAQLLTRL
jgi:heptosyltransferase-2